MDMSHVTSNMQETQICKPINTYGSTFTGSRAPNLLQVTIKCREQELRPWQRS